MSGSSPARSASIHPSDTHSLNKAFLYFQLQREWSHLSRLHSIHQLGQPFGPQLASLATPPPSRSLSSRFLTRPSSSSLRSFISSSQPSRAVSLDLPTDLDQLPTLKFLFQNLARHFPGLNRAPPECWSNIQFIYNDFNTRNFSTSRERQALTKRLVISVGYTRILTTYLAAIVSFSDAPPKPSRPDSELIKLIDQLPETQQVPDDEHPDRALERSQSWIQAGQSIMTAKTGYQTLIHRLINQEEELDRIYDLVAKHDTLADIGQVDQVYSDSERWASMWLAYVLHFIYITGPGSEEIRTMLIKIDGLIPYELMKQGLKIFNPILAIKSVVTLMLGQPFGGLSLFQRILKIVLNNEISLYEKDIETIMASKDDDAEMMSLAFETIKDYVYISGQEKRNLWAEFESKDQDIVMEILSREGSRLSASQIDSFKVWQTEYFDKLQTVGSTQFGNCGNLLRLLVLKRDREQILEMVLEPDNCIIRTIKQFLEIYYPTMYELAAAADLSQRVADTEAFMKDLIKLFQRSEGPVQVADMIDLLDVHKQSYWRFLHEIVGYKDLCKPIKEWFRGVLGLIKNGSRSNTSSSKTDSVPKLRVLLTQICPNELQLDAVLREARSIASHDISVKALAEVQYRTDLLRSKRFEASDQVPSASGYQVAVLKLAKAETEEHTNEKAMLGWAWWICEEKLVGKRRPEPEVVITETNGEVEKLMIKPPQLKAIPELLWKYVELVWT